MKVSLVTPGSFTVTTDEPGWDQPRWELVATAIQTQQHEAVPPIPYPDRFVVAFATPASLRIRTPQSVSLAQVRQVVAHAVKFRMEEAISLLRAVEAAE